MPSEHLVQCIMLAAGLCGVAALAEQPSLLNCVADEPDGKSNVVRVAQRAHRPVCISLRDKLGELAGDHWRVQPPFAKFDLALSPTNGFYNPTDDLLSPIGMRRLRPMAFEQVEWGTLIELFQFLERRGIPEELQ